jgi:hypothetical protein
MMSLALCLSRWGTYGRSRPTRWIGLAVLLNVAPVAAQQDEPRQEPPPVIVTTRVEPKSVTIGTPFRYTIRIESGAEAEVVVPLLVERIGEFLIVDFGAVPESEIDGRLVVERWYDLVGYEAGDLLVEGGSIAYRVAGGGLEEIDVPDALVVIESLLPRSGDEIAAADIRDIKGPARRPPDYRPLFLILAAIVGVAAVIGGILWLRSRRHAVEAAVARRPAHVVALEALARLRRAGLLEAERQAEYYVELSKIVRAYLEGRFELRAPEMTTEEFLQAAQASPDLAAEHRSRLGRFLAEADLVKFARHRPTLSEVEGAHEAAQEFVKATAREVEESSAAA